jgi:hypothetical protein
VIAVDWSGAQRAQGIWCAAIRDGELVDSEPIRTREQAIELVAAYPGPVVAGFDFSFSVPEWFSREHGCSTIDDIWELAHRDGEQWLAPTAPFWRHRCDLTIDKRFRQCERRFPTAKSVFQLVGAGQVGAGSVRGMPLLAELRHAGFAIWPFDEPTDRTAVEIYPSLLRKLRPDLDVGPWKCNDERDAVVSARVMYEHRAEFARLRASTDPTVLLEGEIWSPASATASP